MLYVNIHIVLSLLQGNLKNSNRIINLHQNPNWYLNIVVENQVGQWTVIDNTCITHMQQIIMESRVCIIERWHQIVFAPWEKWDIMQATLLHKRKKQYKRQINSRKPLSIYFKVGIAKKETLFNLTFLWIQTDIKRKIIIMKTSLLH